MAAHSTGRLSLTEQLALVKDVAPEEYDPEQPLDASTSRGDSEAVQTDYLEVGQGKLRKAVTIDYGQKYAGSKTSRAELYDGESQSQNVSEDDEYGDAGLHESSNSDPSDEEAVVNGNISSSGEELTKEQSDADDVDNESTASESASLQPTKHRTTSHAKSPRKTDLDEDTQAMLRQLKAASSADIKKGRDVRKQLNFWDTLLEARIRLQKSLSGNTILPADIFPYTQATSEDTARTINQLEDLSELLFDLRAQLYRQNDEIAIKLGKRKRRSPDYLEVALKAMEESAGPIIAHERVAITKWSDKVAAAASGAVSQSKFKAIGTQNTLTQIENILQSDMSRLIDRTQTRRGASGKSVKVIGRDAIHEPPPGEKDADEEVFDDTDFYQALLREVVESGPTSREGNSTPGSKAAYAAFSQVSRKKASGTLDPRASKGRKLRYHIHEKLQNFMAPIPTNTWEQTQIDELFRGLLGENELIPNGQVDQAGDYGQIDGDDQTSIRIF